MQKVTVNSLKILGLIAVLVVVAVGCGGGGASGKVDLSDANITVSSKEYTEQLILGQMAIQVLENAGATVEDQTRLAGSVAVRKALTSGQVDMYWEYTGTAWITYLGHTKPIGNSHKQYEAVAKEDLKKNGTEARLLDGADGATIYGDKDYSAPYASGSAKVDGYVICPCSMATAGTIAAGAMANLVHRAASVALKEERKLVLVPRETPLSTIHLENLLRLRTAGATILFAAPGFYNAPQTVDDLIEFVVGRCLDQLGIENKLTRRWGQ